LNALYQAICSSELEAARTARFAEDFFEFGGPKRGEAWTIRHCLPTDAEAYCAFVTPWKAYVEGATGWRSVREEPFDGIPEAYEYAGLPVPDPLTLDAWHADFRMIEQERIVPPLVRAALDRYSGGADTVFVRCHWGEEIHNWRIDRALFLELPDPFVEMPQPFGTIAIFPRGAPWFMLNRDDEPILYLAARAELVTVLDRLAPGRVVRLRLNDRHY
jgi:hypothetical protein